jgi:hypothetical protein
MKDKETKMSQLLMESLTMEQISCMLDVVASAGDLKIEASYELVCMNQNRSQNKKDRRTAF